jgi:DNA mismatch repair protein MutS
MANRSMEVLDRKGEIIFLRKLKEGPTAESYGLHVARLAGMNERVLNRASCIMGRLNESGKVLHRALPLEVAGVEKASQAEKSLENCQETLQTAPFSESESPGVTQFIEELASINLDHITPREALNIIYTWKQLLAGKITARTKSRRSISLNRGPSLFD